MNIQTITPEELHAMDPNTRILVDIRSENDYALDTIPGAIRIPRNELIAIRPDGASAVPDTPSPSNAAGSDKNSAQSDSSELNRQASVQSDAASKAPRLPRDRKIVVFCMSGFLSREPVEKLIAAGYDAVLLDGGYGNWLLHQMQKDIGNEEKREQAEKSLRKRFKHEIMGKFVKAIVDYQLLQPNDHIAVCISGGKDSMLMAMCFRELKRRNKIPFEVTYLCMNPGYSDATLGMIRTNADILGIPLTIFETHIFDAVDNIPKSPCYICARMRRGYLYQKAKELGCNKIALGHHYDDVIETTLMSILYSGQVQTMMPKLHSIHFEGMELIRPLYLIREKDIKAWRDLNGLHFIRCACHFTDLCSLEDQGSEVSKRLEARELIAQLKKSTPAVEGNIFRSMDNVYLSAVTGYKDQSGTRHSFLDNY